MYDIYIPKSELLKKYISEFTILKKENFETTRYFAFPQHKGTLSFYSSASIHFEDLTLELDQIETLKESIIILGKYSNPLFVKYEIFVDEISINFNELGINYFLKENYGEIANKPIQYISDEKWTNFAKKMFSSNTEDRIYLLENFLLSQFMNKDLNVIESIIKEMENDLSLKLKDIVLTVKISERTANRLFHKYIGCSPSLYKKILRFRSAVKLNKKGISLTELCLKNEYYDSPHFTKEFKLLTGKGPKHFFNSVNQVSHKKYPYLFI